MTLGFLPLQRFAALSVALALLAAPIPAAQSPAPVAQTQTVAMKGYPAVGAPPVITVLSAGAAPRKPLSYVVPANQKARMDVTMSMSMAASSAVGKVISKDVRPMPTVKVTADLGVTSVAPNGDVTYDLAFTGMTLEARAGVDPKVTQGLQPLVALITSIKGSATVSNRGVTKSTRLDVAHPAMRAMLGQVISSIENLSIPFPDVAVGVAARWEVRQAMVFGDLTTFRPTVFQKTEYEVVSIDGSTVSLKVKTEQTAPPQALSDPSLPVSNQGIAFGAENRLQKMSSSGTGTVVVHLDSLVPTSERQSITSMAMTMSMNEQAASLTIDGDVKITIAPAKDKSLAMIVSRTAAEPLRRDTARAPATAPDLKALRGVTAVNLGGSANSKVNGDGACYPRSIDDRRGDSAGLSIAMGGLLSGASDGLKAGVIEQSPCVSDFLRIDAQIDDAAQWCAASITLELRRGKTVLWHRYFELAGVPAGFSARLIDRVKVDVADLARGIAQANAPSPGTPTTGRMAIAPQFDGAEAFSEGLAAVQIGDGSAWNPAKLGYVDTHGTIVIKPQFTAAKSFSDGLAAVRVGGAGRWGYIDTHGQMAIPPRFDSAGTFSGGLAAVRIGDAATGKWGYIDKQGQLAIPPQFDGADAFSEGLAAVQISDGLALVHINNTKTGKWGYIDMQGQLAIPPQFDGAEAFSEGLAAVQIGGGSAGKQGYIDRRGTIVIKPQFGSAQSFRRGLAAVRVGGAATDKWGYIDPRGTMVIKPQFYHAGLFSDGLAEFSDNKTAGWSYARNSVRPPPGQLGSPIETVEVTDNKESRWGYLDAQGKIVLPPQFGQAVSFTDGLAPVLMRHGRCGAAQWGYISR